MNETTAQPNLGFIGRHSDVMVAAAAVMVVGMMILPMPHWLLDILLCANIALALSILLVTMYTSQPLEFSSFPSMLLMTTLFRLALNVSATRLILLHSSAGQVITSFGSVVVGGNYVVGIVVFAILVIIQFIVITSGAGRVAEVAARFTLDAMPGKQMAIDADLSAGLIDETQARHRRVEISREADFYGAMDGAGKFVRGDAIAAIIMIIVNIIGGFVVGVAQRSMNLTDALQTYTLLTVGEGLVTQIPALLVSTAMGLMVTKNGGEKSLGYELITQICSKPKALSITAAVFAVMMVVPGMPKMPLLLAATMCATAAYMLSQSEKQAQEDEKRRTEQQHDAPKAPESMTDLIGVDPLTLEIGYGLIPLADPKQGGDLLDRITMIRRQAAMEMGVLVPAIRVRDNVQLGSNEYVVRLRGTETARGEIFPEQYLAMNPGAATDKLTGIETTEPAFGLPATWIAEGQKMFAEVAGYTVVEPTTVLVTHLTEIVRRHSAELLTRQETQDIVDAARQEAPAVVNELIPEAMALGDVQKVLQNLLRERVSVKDIVTILEALADFAPSTKDTDILTEYVRQRLGLAICRRYAADDGTLTVFTLHPGVEQVIVDGIRQTELGARLILDPGRVQELLTGVRDQIELMAQQGHEPVMLCSPRTRLHMRRLIEQSFPTVAVLSYAEIAPDVNIESIGLVTLDEGLVASTNAY
ncbi:MAG: flagellar biosynthesis protein FlhA [Armatimonadetes bacterium]|nr:flagellar biosynthesis protein FlhA [Armatimonadota bacterium]